MPRRSLSVSADVDIFLESIHQAIENAMRHRHDLSKRFICEPDLRQIWGTFGLQTIFPSRSWNTQTIDVIRNEYLKVLSILIYVGITPSDLMAHFRAQFVGYPNQRSDRNLPLHSKELSFLQGRLRRAFCEEQYAFIPVVIEERENSHVQIVESERRLPFLEGSVEIGWGGYGRITEVTIAPRQFYSQARELENPHVRTNMYHGS